MKINTRNIAMLYWAEHPSTSKIIKIMKLMVLLMLVALLQVSGKSYSQITLKEKNASIEKIFKKIEQQTDYVFFFKGKLNNVALNVNLDDVSINEALDICFKDLPLSYKIVDKTIVINQQAPVRAVPSVQQMEVRGRVIDSLGSALIGVTVKVKGSNVATITNETGDFILRNLKENAILEFSYIGFISREISAEEDLRSIVLSPIESALQEVVVVGFGTQRKISLTGSIASVQTKELKQSAVSNLSSALVGRLPGLIARSDTGEPGQSGSGIWLRGHSTYSGSNSPLIMVDGVPRDGFGFIDPNEVESITILKDASSTAVYGVRGANGVVLVTTKRGQVRDKPTVEFNVEQAIQTPTRLPEYLNSMDFFRYHRLGLINDGKLAEAEKYTNEYISRYDQSLGWLPDLEYEYLHPNVNWMQEMLKPSSLRTTANVNVTGGTSKTRYFVSGSYLTEPGIYSHEDAVEEYNVQAVEQRFNFRSNIDMEISRWFKAELGLATIVRNRNRPVVDSQDFFAVLKSTPAWAMPVFNPDGSFGEMRDQNNPYAQLTGRGYRRTMESYLQGTVGATANLSFITEGLSARTRFSYDAISNGGYNRETSYWSYLYQGNGNYERIRSGQDFLGYSTANDYWAININPEFYINYDKKVDNHNIAAMVLYRLTNNSVRSADAVGALPRREQGVVGRLAYGYDDKYFAEANFGYNGSENFAPGSRWGFFPSFSLGWAINKENFLKDATWLDLLKIRASHGKVGNQDPGTRFAYQTRWNLSAGGYSFGENYDNSIGGALEGVIGNAFVTWETANMTNLGLDILLRKNIFELTADVFYERRSSIFTASDRITSGLLGVTPGNLPTLNAGVVENKGFELDAKHSGRINSNLSYHARANFTYSKNKILDYLEAPTSDRPWQMRKGRGINEIITHVSQGYFQNWDDFNNYPSQAGYGAAQPGDTRYEDINNDNVINDYDRKYIGKLSEPNQILGIAGGLSYKGFDLSFLFQGAFGRSVFIDGVTLFGNQYAFRNIMADLYGNSWTPENTEAVYPRPMSMNTQNNTMKSTNWLRNGNYVRLKNVEVGYVIPKSLTNSLGINEVRIYANGNNLITWDHVKLFDPEEGNGSPKYPLVSTYNLGLKVKF